MSSEQKSNQTVNSSIDRVNYDSLDKAKLAFISASKETLSFAAKYGSVPQEQLGASANIFALDLQKYLNCQQQELYISLICEGLGTADDARPTDLSKEELEDFWYNIGIKTISSLTNDAASAGLQTILISLYLPSSNPDKVFDSTFLSGFTQGILNACKIIGCTWLSGETPQLKNKLFNDKIDIAGSLFALAPPGKRAIDGNNLQAGNKIVFVGSSGPHENGFTTLRSLAAQLPEGYRSKLPDGQEFWRAINAPSKLYTPLVQALLQKGIEITNLENITGHGWLKLMRSKKELCYLIENCLPILPVFSYVQEKLSMSQIDMLKTFNYGLGFAIFLKDESDIATTISVAQELGHQALYAGQVLPSSQGRKIVVQPFNLEINDQNFLLQKS